MGRVLETQTELYVVAKIDLEREAKVVRHSKQSPPSIGYACDSQQSRPVLTVKEVPVLQL